MDTRDDDSGPTTLPAYVTPTSWLEATVDLSAFGLGNVYIKDGAAHAVTEWVQASEKGGLLSVAKLLAAYVDHGDDPSFPPARSGWQKWDAWLKGGVTQKVVKRLTDAIFAFMAYVGDESKRVPN
jgi:hypothetical protein